MVPSNQMTVIAPKRGKRRLTQHTLVSDHVTNCYVFFERVLWVCLFITTTVAIILTIIGAYVYHYKLYYLDKHLLHTSSMLHLDHVKNKATLALAPVLTGESDESVYVGRWGRILLSVSYTLLFLVITATLFGIITILQKNIIFVACFILFNFVSIGAQLYFGYQCLFLYTPYHKGIAKQMTRMLAMDYDLMRNTFLDRLVNSVMIKGECCGINGPEDFYDMNMTDYKGVIHKVDIPPACCKKQYWANPKTVYKTIMTCVKKGGTNNPMIYKKGCYNVWLQKFIDYTRLHFEIIGGIFIALQGIQLLIGCIIMRVAHFALNSKIDPEDMDLVKDGALRNLSLQSNISKMQILNVRKSFILRRKESNNSTYLE